MLEDKYGVGGQASEILHCSKITLPVTPELYPSQTELASEVRCALTFVPAIAELGNGKHLP